MADLVETDVDGVVETGINVTVSDLDDCIPCKFGIIGGCVMTFAFLNIKGLLEFFNNDIPLFFEGEISTAFLMSFT